MWLWARQVWSEPGQAARPAIIASILLAALSAIAFVALVTVISVSKGVSVGTAIFGPGPGTGIFLIYFAAPAIVFPGLVAQALRRRTGWVRTVGALGALLIAAACAIWIIAVGIDVAMWLTTGVVTDIGDLAGEIALVPVAAVFAALNARAAVLGIGDLRRQRREPLTR